MGGGCAGSASHLLEDIRLRLFAGRRLATACRSSVRGQQAVDQYRCLAAGLHGRSQSRLGMAAEGTARGPWLGQGCAREFLNCQPAALYFYRAAAVVAPAGGVVAGIADGVSYPAFVAGQSPHAGTALFVE